jgi:hypothetical protein
VESENISIHCYERSQIKIGCFLLSTGTCNDVMWKARAIWFIVINELRLKKDVS